MKKLLLIALCAFPAFAASPATCYPASGVTNLTNWNVAASWSSSAGGSGSTCAASGGTSVSYRGATVTINAGVPGAAGSKDMVVLPSSGSGTYHVSVNVELGDPTSGATGLSMDIGSTSTLVVDDGVLLSMRGYDTIANGKGVLRNNGTFQQAAGSAVWWDTADPNHAEVQNNGRFDVGASSGTWATVSAASPGVWTAALGGTLPSVNVGDLVEYDLIPQPVTTGTGSFGPPYAAFPCNKDSDGYVTDCRAPSDFSAPPVYPLTDDTATCTSGTCTVPYGVPLCVVSASPLTLGWPTSLAFSCAGAVAMNITDAGSGYFWLMKPAFFEGLPSNITWATAQSLSAVSPTCSYDAVKSACSMYAPISNAAGTGPGRKGDNSLSFSSVSITPSGGTTYTSLTSEKDHPWDLAQNGDYYINYSLGEMFFYGGYIADTLSATWKTASGNPLRTPRFSTSGSCAANRETVFQNVHVENLFSNNTGSIPVFLTSNYCTTLSHSGFSWTHVTDRNTGGLFEMRGNVGTASSPISITNNAHYNTSDGNPGANQNGGPNIGYVFDGNNYVDVSNNYIETHYVDFYAAGTNSDQFTNTNWTFTNNIGYYMELGWLLGMQHVNKYPDLLIQRNLFSSPGDLDSGTEPGIEAVFWNSYMGTSGHPAIFEWNYMYGGLRQMFFDSYSDTRYNLMSWFRHHGSIPEANANYIVGAGWHHNIGAEKGHDDGCVATGYDGIQWIDGLKIYNNTCTGTDYSAFSISDIGDASNNTMTGLVLRDNVAVTDKTSASPPTGAISYITADNGNAFGQYQCTSCGWNALYGLGNPYAGTAGTVSPNLVDPTLHRFTNPKQGGVPYNTSGTRNVKGVTLQNPDYTGNTVTNGILAWTYISASNITVTWDDGLGTGAGAAQQVAWGGPYTPLGVLEAANQALASITMPVSYGTQTDYQTGCPDGTFARITSGAASGKIYAVIRCGGSNGTLVIPSPSPSNTIAMIPDPVLDGYSSGDTFVIYQSTIVLPNGDASQHVTLAIDPRNTPTSSQTDTGISLNLVDYCASGCAGTLDPSIPGASQNDASSFLWGTATGSGGNAGTNAPVNSSILEPMRGGNMVDAWRASSAYVPTGSAWLTAGHAGGPIGATVLSSPATAGLLLGGATPVSGLSLATLSNGQLSTLTNGQLSTLTN